MRDACEMKHTEKTQYTHIQDGAGQSDRQQVELGAPVIMMTEVLLEVRTEAKLETAEQARDRTMRATSVRHPCLVAIHD